MELWLINRINCFLFPNDETRSLFGVCYRINKEVKANCLAGNKDLVQSLCDILKMPQTSSYFNNYNTLIRKIGDLSFLVSVEYLLFRALGVPYTEKDNYVIISAYANSPLIEYFSFSTGEKLKTIHSPHPDIPRILKTNNLLVSCSGYDEHDSDSKVILFDIISGTILHSVKFEGCKYVDL